MGTLQGTIVHIACAQNIWTISHGDRENECKGILRPVGIEINSKKGYVIIYRCEKCGKTVRNKAAADENMDLIIDLTVKRS